MKKELKRFTVGYGDDGDWILNSKLTNDIKGADIIIIPGGIDVGSSMYNEPRGHYTQAGEPGHRDEVESKALEYAFNEGLYGLGICRGAQLQTVLAGGKLVQHVTNHHGSHDCKTIDGDIIHTNSIHHQMCYPWDLPEDEYIVIAWTEGLSTTYLNGYNEEISFPNIALTEDGNVIEPEIIWYPKKRWLGAQWHPEMYWYKNVEENHALDYLNKVLQNVIQDPYYYHKVKQENESTKLSKLR